MEAFWQNMLKKPVNKLDSRQTHLSPLAGIGFLISKGNFVTFNFQDTAIGKSNAVNIRGEVFQGMFSGAYRLGMNNPVLFPYFGINIIKKIGLF